MTKQINTLQQIATISTGAGKVKMPKVDQPVFTIETAESKAGREYPYAKFTKEGWASLSDVAKYRLKKFAFKGYNFKVNGWVMEEGIDAQAITSIINDRSELTPIEAANMQAGIERTARIKAEKEANKGTAKVKQSDVNAALLSTLAAMQAKLDALTKGQ